MTAKIHTYKGHTIYPCECQIGNARPRKHWYVQSFHAPTGLPWSEVHCAHVYTLAQAREIVDDDIRFAALAE